ncbi:MAG: hypothetical protein LBD45_08420 [Bacteroidales bacterium]|jgi:hypothetical protein|nr:hypothetical protein [Bacteroidales bacterium]
MSKYESLWQHLQNDGRDTFQLTFEEIKAITGFDIDHSFLNYKKEAKEYDYEVRKISLKGKHVTFIKIEK